MRPLSFLLIGLTTTFALAQSGTSTTGTSATSGMSMSGDSMSGSSMMGGSMNGTSMSGSSTMGGSMNGTSMSGSSTMGGSMNGASTSGMSGGMGAMATAADQTFVTAAGQGNTFEIEAAKLALTNSTNSTVKAYAQKMISDHTTLGASVKAAVSKDDPSLKVPTGVAAGQQATLQKLKGLKGAAFDAAYKNANVSSHAETYGLFQQYVKAGKLASLKSTIEKALPTVKMHWDMAKTLPTT